MRDKTPFDIACENVEEDMLKKAAETKRMAPYLNEQLKKVQKVDKSIEWYENKIGELNKQKQNELAKMDDLLDLAMVSSHSLKNGYTVKPANSMKIKVVSTQKFLGWLKKNRTPLDVLLFFEGALKLANLKRFCEKEYNEQRLKGNMEPKVDGIEYGDITYRRLTTGIKKEKKNV